MRNFRLVLVFILFVASFVTLLWSRSQSKSADSAAKSSAVEIQHTLERLPAESSAPPAAPQTQTEIKVPSPAGEPNVDQAREEIRRRLAQSNPTSIGTLQELPKLKAIGKRDYHSGMGREVETSSGYVIFESTQTKSSLQHFDGVNFPVVVDPNRPVYGIVDGQLIVVFKNYPVDVSQFLVRNSLAMVSEAAHLKTAFVAPNRYPANLVKVRDRLAALPEVASVELSISFGRRRAH